MLAVGEFTGGALAATTLASLNTGGLSNVSSEDISDGPPAEPTASLPPAHESVLTPSVSALNTAHDWAAAQEVIAAFRLYQARIDAGLIATPYADAPTPRPIS